MLSASPAHIAEVAGTPEAEDKPDSESPNESKKQTISTNDDGKQEDLLGRMRQLY